MFEKILLHTIILAENLFKSCKMIRVKISHSSQKRNQFEKYAKCNSEIIEFNTFISYSERVYIKM